MKSQLSTINALCIYRALLMIALLCAMPARVQSQVTTPKDQDGFATPQLAAKALVKAADSYDVSELLKIFGPEGKDFVASADPVHDKSIAQEFVQKAHEKNFVKVAADHATLLVGKDNWPLPVPIVKKEGKWYFDTKAGRSEILIRRIGANELDAIRICRGFVEAQKEYAAALHDDSSIHQYAQKIISTPGKQDGLYWRNADGSFGGPISEPIAHAIEEGYSDKSPSPYHGYYFKVLKGQGPAAPLGTLNFVFNDAMIGGFALVAVPAEYRVTGVKTFLVSHDGIVYQKDLGPDSLKIVKAMERYDPDKSWKRTNDEK